MDYSKELTNVKWKKRRIEILNRDKNVCRICGSKNKLEVHHLIKYIDKKTNERFFPWEYSDDCLITLCNECHHQIHKKQIEPSKYIINRNIGMFDFLIPKGLKKNRIDEKLEKRLQDNIKSIISDKKSIDKEKETNKTTINTTINTNIEMDKNIDIEDFKDAFETEINSKDYTQMGKDDCNRFNSLPGLISDGEEYLKTCYKQTYEEYKSKLDKKLGDVITNEKRYGENEIYSDIVQLLKERKEKLESIISDFEKLNCENENNMLYKKIFLEYTNGYKDNLRGDLLK